MTKQLEVQTHCYWKTLDALSRPLAPDDRARAASTLWQTARCAKTPVLRDRALDAMQRHGLVVTRISGGAA